MYYKQHIWSSCSQHASENVDTSSCKTAGLEAYQLKKDRTTKNEAREFGRKATQPFLTARIRYQQHHKTKFVALEKTENSCQVSFECSHLSDYEANNAL